MADTPARVTQATEGVKSVAESATAKTAPSSGVPKKDITKPATTSGIIPNVLEKFVSYNTIFTISALTTEQVNFPESANSYKSNNLGEIILRSGGGRPDNRIKTAYSTIDNKFGQYEFYIDNVNIDAIMAYDKRTKGSNATNITFDVVEPYSMGMFLQVLQLAAASTSDDGVIATYTEAPFLLTIEFIGYDSSGNIVPVDDALNRHIPFNFGNIELEVTSSGSKYTVTAVPFNEDALKDSVALIKEDVAISGLDVQEILQTGKNSLQLRLNTHKKEIAKQGSETGKEEYVPDQFVIIFPKDKAEFSAPSVQEDAGQSATVNPKDQPKNSKVENRLALKKTSVAGGEGSVDLLVQETTTLNKIGSSPMGFTGTTGGESQPVEGNKAQSDPDKPVKRKDNVYDPANKVFRFPQGTSILNIISEVLLMSEYCKSGVNESDDTGMKNWFRIETQVYNLKPNLGNANRAKRPKLYVFKVVEYKVHEHRFKAPGAAPMGYEALKQNCVKEYNYIYSGKNVDILNFNIKLQTSMFTTAYSDRNALAGSVYGAGNGAATEPNSQPTSSEANKTSSDKGMPVAPVGELHKRYRNVGGGPNDDYRSLIAKNFQEALLNSSADMLTIEMEIMGDPYFIADSGMGNFSDQPASFNLTKNGAMNYQSGEVDIIINFKTPVDYNSKGVLDFSEGVTASGFSGLYNVQEVSNSFRGGKFVQVLKAIRRPVQEPGENKEAEKKVEPAKEAAKENPPTPVEEKPTPPKNLTFAQAFAAARKQAGNSAGRFTWTNPKTGVTGVYHTGYKNERVLPSNDEGKSVTTTPGTAPKKAIDSKTSGTRGTQVEFTQGTNTKVPGKD